MENTQTPSKTKVHNVIILDRSGSMHSIREAAISGCNEVISAARIAKEKFSHTMDQMISVILFDSTGIDTLAWDSDPMSTPLLTHETYIPGAATPLYDAVGITLVRLERQIASQGEDESVIVTIITDGYENASREYSGRAIKGMIDNLRAKGWSFAYMGADHDVERVASSISISNTIRFEKSRRGTMDMFEKERRAKERYWEKLDRMKREEPCISKEEKMRRFRLFSDEYLDESKK